MEWYNYMIIGAERSRFNARHWFRYLRKVIFETHSYLTDEDVERLFTSDKLTNFQKITLKYAVQNHTPTHEYVTSLNKPAKLTNFHELMEKYTNG